jgi:hypothetical protein
MESRHASAKSVMMEAEEETEGGGIAWDECVWNVCLNTSRCLLVEAIHFGSEFTLSLQKCNMSHAPSMFILRVSRNASQRGGIKSVSNETYHTSLCLLGREIVV